MKDEMTKKQQTIYCILVVFVLLLLAFGDQIILHTLPQNPNPNNTIFGNEEGLRYYEREGFEPLTIEEVWEKLARHESFYLLLLRNDCYTCELMMNKVQSLRKDEKIYYLNRDSYSKENELWQRFVQYDGRILDNHELTPFFLDIQNGVLMDTLVGNPKIETLEQFLWKSE